MSTAAFASFSAHLVGENGEEPAGADHHVRPPQGLLSGVPKGLRPEEPHDGDGILRPRRHR
ncbi:MAG: hypothetical protein LC792_29165 [Actinobacteria bacterium]|nr:hypothetical protein [Actinomycetota bacterium]